MNRLCLIILLLLAGCGGGSLPGSSMSLSPSAVGYGGPSRGVIHDPVVWVAGDSLVGAWGNSQIQQQNPLWSFYPPPVDPATGEVDSVNETSGALLTRMQTLLAAPPYPNVLIILVGTYDMLAPGLNWETPCGDPAPADNTCQNLDAIYTLAHSKGIKVLVCDVPYTDDAGAAGTALLNQYPELMPDEQLMDFYFTDSAGGFPNTSDGIVDIEGAIAGEPVDGAYAPPAIDWTDDGLNPNATGALAFQAVAEAAVAGLKVGGAR
jgi:hypothetical protein